YEGIPFTFSWEVTEGFQVMDETGRLQDCKEDTDITLCVRAFYDEATDDTGENDTLENDISENNTGENNTAKNDIAEDGTKKSDDNVIKSKGSINGELSNYEETNTTKKEWSKVMELKAVRGADRDYEDLRERLMKELKNADAENPYDEVLTLPQTVEAKEVKWIAKDRDMPLFALIMSVVTAVMVFALKDNDLEKEVRERRRRLKRDYPDFVGRLLIYLYSGLSMRVCFERLAESYGGGGKKIKQKELYSELSLTLKEMNGGVAEREAYENMARRMGIREYKELAVLITRDIKTGGDMLKRRLREECISSRDEYVKSVRKRGEKAQTWLLIPMMMYLGIVVIIVMLPAFKSMGG
ncbi:MAG: type II secretion system F family protein, partial [Lachnospiraceae bacterium]|nr:type II secretion system F family protein [Lachnospiraceae bacterium]